MAFSIITSESYLLPSSVGAIKNFSAATSVRIRLTNTSGSTVVGINLWADYDSTSTGDTEKILSELELASNESVVIDGGPFNFASGGRLSGQAGTNNVVSIHLSMATVS